MPELTLSLLRNIPVEKDDGATTPVRAETVEGMVVGRSYALCSIRQLQPPPSRISVAWAAVTAWAAHPLTVVRIPMCIL